MALPAADNFNRADALTLGSNWTVQVDGFRIVSNTCLGINSAVRQFVFWNADSFTNDQYSQFVIATAASVSGPTVRASGVSPNENCYFAFVRDTGQGASHIFKRVNGVDTSLSNTSFAVANGDTFKLEVSGTSLTLYKNSVSVLTATDSDLASGSAGMHDFGGGNFLDSWEGGNVGGGGGGGGVTGGLLLLGAGS